MVEGKSKLVLPRERVNIDWMKELLPLFENPPSSLPTPTPAGTPFDPTKSLVLKSMEYPSVQASIEKQLQILQERQQQYETQIPERCLCLFRAENGFNPRNFGDTTYQKMLYPSDSESMEDEGSVGDESLIREVLQRKQQQREDNAQLKTKAKRDLETLQKQRMYKRTTIRIYFPDHTVLQAYFAPRETLQDVMDVVRSALREPYQAYPFYLFTAPPKEM